MPAIRTNRTAGVHVALGAITCAALVTASAGCKDSEQRRTTLFEEAERHYRDGEYDAALDDYQVFLERYPRNRLADTARLRIRSINREIQSMMSRDDMPTPNYRGDEQNTDESNGPDQTNSSDGSSTSDAGDGS